MRSSATKCVESSGNVFTDLDLANADELLAKAETAVKIARLLESRKLTQKALATLLDASQSDVSLLASHRFGRFSTERLMQFLVRLRRDAEFTIKAHARAKAWAGFLIGAGLTALSMHAEAADTIAGRAVAIDGGTIEIRGERLRILDVVAPERSRNCFRDVGFHEWAAWPCGEEAALALADWIGDRIVSCETTGKDSRERWLARCSVAGEDMAEWLAAHGWATPSPHCKCEVIRDAAYRAKLTELGIWAGSDFRKAN